MRLIDADALIAELNDDLEKAIKEVNTVSFDGLWTAMALVEMLTDGINELPTIEPKRGEWKEKEVVDYEETTITQWQSACCSVCGKYHTTPYMYYFDNYNFCPNCGADMRKGSE